MCILLKWCKWRFNDCSHCCMIHLSLFGYNLSSSMIIWSMSTFVGSSEYKVEWEKKISFTFSLRSFAKTSLRCKEISGLFTRVYASSHFHLAFRLLRSNISCFSSKGIISLLLLFFLFNDVSDSACKILMKTIATGLVWVLSTCMNPQYASKPGSICWNFLGRVLWSSRGRNKAPRMMDFMILIKQENIPMKML